MSRFDTIGRNLPRVPFGHSIISATCRQVQPDALVEAVERLREGYDQVVSRRGDVLVHVLLVATWPEDEDRQASGAEGPESRTATGLLADEERSAPSASSGDDIGSERGEG